MKALQTIDRRALAAQQLRQLNTLVDRVLPENRFYADKLKHVVLPLTSLEELRAWPVTTKAELEPPPGQWYSANTTWPPEAYVHFHRTSGTRGKPLVILDTAEDWQHWISAWQCVLDAGCVAAPDRVLMAFSFGPFIGFWTAYDAAKSRGALVIPTGGLRTLERLELIQTTQVSVICCTPSYALHLAEAALDRGQDPAGMGVRLFILAGEPGGSLPAVRERIQSAWNAQVLDHAGATEVGPWGVGDLDGRGLYLLEQSFIAEFFSLKDDAPAAPGELSELVLTSLCRPGCPVFRYRTGDLVRPQWSEHGPVLLEGGILGRRDDMLVIRGVNLFPSSIDQILRESPTVAEYRLTVSRSGQLDELLVEVEDAAGDLGALKDKLRLRLGLNVAVQLAAPGTLPRFEGKARRLVDKR